MERATIPADKLRVPAFHMWEGRGLLLAVGDFQKNDYNCMTVGWGGIGVMWGKPIAMIVVRPTRYTIQFMGRFDTFTLSAFPEAYGKSLSYCGSHSGTEGDKAKAAGLTAIASRCVRSPGFHEAELICGMPRHLLARFRSHTVHGSEHRGTLSEEGLPQDVLRGDPRHLGHVGMAGGIDE